MEGVLSLLITLLTAALGAWLAFLWQSRAQRNERYYTALTERLRAMRQSTEFATPILSNRVYAIQRLILNIGDPAGFEKAAGDEKNSSLVHNDSLMKIELSLQMYFQNVYLVELEDWQRRIRALPVAARRRQFEGRSYSEDILIEVQSLRHELFQLLGRMIQEAEHLDRQIHYGVKLTYSRNDVRFWKKSELIKGILFPRKDFSSVFRPASDFLEPLRIDGSRTRIDEL